MGKMKVKWEDFRLYQCSKKEKPLIHPKELSPKLALRRERKSLIFLMMMSWMMFEN